MHSPLLTPFLIVCLGAVLGLCAPQKSPSFGDVDINYAAANCRLPVNLGTKCPAGKPAVKWFFEPRFGLCLAFKYNGCGGNANRFNDEGECMRCRPKDMNGCAGIGGAVKDGKGEQVYCNQPQFFAPGSKPKEECPKGSQCQNFGMISLCCDSAKQKKYNDALSPKCPGGKKPASFKSGGFDNNFLGQSCMHDFCPNGYVCKQLEPFAHCCPK